MVDQIDTCRYVLKHLVDYRTRFVSIIKRKYWMCVCLCTWLHTHTHTYIYIYIYIYILLITKVPTYDNNRYFDRSNHFFHHMTTSNLLFKRFIHQTTWYRVPNLPRTRFIVTLSNWNGNDPSHPGLFSCHLWKLVHSSLCRVFLMCEKSFTIDTPRRAWLTRATIGHQNFSK